jgi:hypothetical protein
MKKGRQKRISVREAAQLLRQCRKTYPRLGPRVVRPVISQCTKSDEELRLLGVYRKLKETGDVTESSFLGGAYKGNWTDSQRSYLRSVVRRNGLVLVKKQR